MDPTQCFLEMIDAMRDGDMTIARERAEALHGWLESGGFYPQNHAETEVRGHLANVLRRTAAIERSEEAGE